MTKKNYLTEEQHKAITFHYSKEAARQGKLNPYNYQSRFGRFGIGNNGYRTKEQHIPLYQQIVVGHNTDKEGNVTEVKDFVKDEFGNRVLIGYKTIKRIIK